ncbi:hypothetical protein [Singulisphaera sp. PoT]|uniref:bestrophin-like domain n=1 Tax=Singulisphaera sp. PoT TaxID=3411797 RepID=UPI003BF507A4
MPDDWPTWIVVTSLLALMFVADEVGYRLGRRFHHDETEASRTVSSMLKGSVFGLVALLLGFSFSVTSSRHDLRRKIVLDEANAAGTCHLRAGLLHEPQRGQIRETLRKYVAARIAFYENGLDPSEVTRTNREMDRLLNELWATVEDANLSNSSVVLTSQIIPAANEVIDLNTTRAWAIRNHLPVPVVVLLEVCVIVSSLLIGHSSGQSGRRHAEMWAAFNILFALVLFVVLDFDRPRRGLVQVDHTPLYELNASLATNPAR